MNAVMTPVILSVTGNKKLRDAGTALQQLQYESNTWKRLLAFMMEENVYLKNRLADVLKENFDKAMLEEMEYYQGRFVKEDESVSLLRNDIATLDKLLIKDMPADAGLLMRANKKMKEIRNNILLTEATFSKLKSDFNTFLVAGLE
jgi:hypothetical protein